MFYLVIFFKIYFFNVQFDCTRPNQSQFEQKMYVRVLRPGVQHLQVENPDSLLCQSCRDGPDTQVMHLTMVTSENQGAE